MPAPKSSDVIAAATECDAKKLKTLIDAKADPNAVGHSGNSALHCAALKGDTAAALATVKLLLEAGADCTSENDGGENPLALAQKKKHTKVVTALEEATEKAAAAEAERKKAKAAAKAAAKAKASGGGGGGGSSSGSGGADGAPGEPLPYRRTASVGWKPLLKDWNKYVTKWKSLTDDLEGKKIALSFSNKTADASFAKGLDAELKAAGAQSRMLTKWPVNGWVEACVFAAEQADFAIVVHSANYDEGNYSIAERFLIKEADVPYLQIELDKPEHADYCASAADGLSFVKANLVLNQTARVQTNTMACTWTMSTLEGEARTAYNKLTKVWTPKGESTAPLMLDLDELAQQAVDQSNQAAAAKKAAAVGADKESEAEEVDDLKRLFGKD